ncbi:MAG: hypothetical protein STHCBS139747_004703 [Sporothrix thermara]
MPPHIISGLTTREAILDAMNRVLLAVDTNDLDLFNSAWAGEDVLAHVGFEEDTKVLPGLSLIQKRVFERPAALDTTHSYAAPRVHVEEGADTAYLTAVFMAQHCPGGRGKEPDGPKYLVGGNYMVDLVKVPADGVWKIKKLVVKMIWAQGDPSVME